MEGAQMHAFSALLTKSAHKHFVTVTLFQTAGNSWDLSSAVMDRALMHADCVYKFPAQRVKGHMCRTNIASNTAFRGFGGPQVRLRWFGLGIYLRVLASYLKP
jgi:xanthine dehydrogenase/oxidase